jgi:hypothetical protein
MRAEVLEALQEAGRVVGVTYRDQDGATHQVRARLTVAADGRGSARRRSAGLRPTEFGAPIDVLWFRLPKQPTDRPQSFGRLAAGHLMILIDQGDYWQIAYVIGKDAAGEICEQGLERFRASVANLLARPLGDGTLSTWHLARVQLRRTLPTVLVQRAIQDFSLSPCWPAASRPATPGPAGAAPHPILQAMPARLIGLGVLPEHVHSPTAGVCRRPAAHPSPARHSPAARSHRPDRLDRPPEWS